MAASKPIVGRPDKQAPGKRGIVPYLAPDMFRDAIQGLGLLFRWSRAVLCPCRLNAETDQWNPQCTLCGGDGWWYVHPDSEVMRQSTNRLDYIEDHFAFSEAHVGVDYDQNFGQWVAGEGQIVVQNANRVGFRDRFIGMQQEMPWTELIIRDGTSDVIAIGKGKRSTEKQRRTMRYEPVRIELIAIADGTRFYEGHDWILTEETLSEPRKVQWLPGKGPDVDTLFTIYYICRPVWIVDKATYATQHALGPKDGIKGPTGVQEHPTTYHIQLDYLTQQRGS